MNVAPKRAVLLNDGGKVNFTGYDGRMLTAEQGEQAPLQQGNIDAAQSRLNAAREELAEPNK
jgi:hypothetical protein